jgi:hypothetical protein
MGVHHKKGTRTTLVVRHPKIGREHAYILTHGKEREKAHEVRTRVLPKLQTTRATW